MVHTIYDNNGAELFEGVLRAGVCLPNADLSGEKLRMFDLSDANLSDANLSGADLSYADLSYADLRDADLSGANLRGANLRGADLTGADLTGVDLRGADLRGVDLRGADLRGADLSRADLSGANLIGADLTGADLSGANLIGADLTGANLEVANLEGVLSGDFKCPPTGPVIELPGVPSVRLAAGLPSGADTRKGLPVFSGFVKYFPHAIAACAELSRIGNEQHSPGEPLHWDHSKSTDELDALTRHLTDHAINETHRDPDGVLAAVKILWRAAANLERMHRAGANIFHETPK